MYGFNSWIPLWEKSPRSCWFFIDNMFTRDTSANTYWPDQDLHCTPTFATRTLKLLNVLTSLAGLDLRSSYAANVIFYKPTLSRGTAFSTISHVRQAKTQISLRDAQADLSLRRAICGKARIKNVFRRRANTLISLRACACWSVFPGRTWNLVGNARLICQLVK